MSIPAMFVAEQFVLALGDKTEDNLWAKAKHDANIDLFLLNARVMNKDEQADLARRVEQGELFPVFTAFNTVSSKVRKINNRLPP